MFIQIQDPLERLCVEYVFMTALRDQFSSDKIDEVWNSANSLFKWRFRFVLIQKFGYHGNVM